MYTITGYLVEHLIDLSWFSSKNIFFDLHGAFSSRTTARDLARILNSNASFSEPKHKNNVIKKYENRICSPSLICASTSTSSNNFLLY